MQVKNYSIELEKMIQNLKSTPTLLLHSCCAPCSSYVLNYLSKHFKITVLYYNPNISPKEEYEKRKQEQIRLIQEMPFENKVDIMDCDYDNDQFETLVKGLEEEREGGSRCFRCYRLRLEKTALLASQNHYDYFGTTLTVSPYKNSQKLNEIGYDLEQIYHIPYLYSDFKKKEGYKKSIEFSKIYHLYRQNYCGCVYSKKQSENKQKA
ncbi:MAG: epoxyqueuosine reductase QueH [Tenericutes bacterium]|nr:epoxyqueuosine reductase QueH [Mycoplasmatota bacterium]